MMVLKPECPVDPLPFGRMRGELSHAAPLSRGAGWGRTKGISPCPVTSRTGLYNPGEPGISPKSEAGAAGSPGALEAAFQLPRAVEQKVVPRARQQQQ